MRRVSLLLTITLFAVPCLAAGCGGGTSDDAGAGEGSSATAQALPEGASGVVAPAEDVVHTSVAPSMTGVVAYYALDGDATDGGPQSLDGVVVGATAVADRFGIAEGALSFAALEQFVHFAQPLVSGRLTSTSVSLWFRTETTSRGVLFNEGRKGGPGLQLRVMPGKDVLQVRSGGAFTLEADSAHNDGAWHHAVVTADGETAALWIDGQPVAEHTEGYAPDEVMEVLPTLARDGVVDADNAKDAFTGALDDIAVFDRPLNADEIQQLYTEGPPRPPTADAGENISRFGLQISVDGSRSTDNDGEIVSYLWNFGDGSPEQEGVALSHTYADFGVYEVRLTVTDDEGAQAFDTLFVSVRDPECVTPNCGQVDTWNPEWSQLEVDMLAEVNRNRLQGADCEPGTCAVEPCDWHPAVPALEMNEVARVAARLHSLDMVDRDFFAHDNPDGLDPFVRMENAGYQGPDPWGENIQAGSSTGEDAVASLMTSPGHCRNIMDPEYKVIGLGYAYGAQADYGHYWTQCFGGGH